MTETKNKAQQPEKLGADNSVNDSKSNNSSTDLKSNQPKEN